MIDQLLEHVNDLVVVPRLCELCGVYTAVMYWMGSWPSFYACRCCWEAWRVEGEAQPWVAPIGGRCACLPADLS